MIKELEIMDKPLNQLKSIMLVNSFIYNQNKFITDNHLTNQSFELLMLIVNYHMRTGNGISCSMMVKYSSYSVNYYKKIYSMLNTLHNNGMVEYIGNGWLNCKLFAPTDKAINSITSLVSSITV